MSTITIHPHQLKTEIQELFVNVFGNLMQTALIRNQLTAENYESACEFECEIEANYTPYRTERGEEGFSLGQPSEPAIMELFSCMSEDGLDFMDLLSEEAITDIEEKLLSEKGDI